MGKKQLGKDNSREFRVPFAIRDADGALERDVKLLRASAADSNGILGLAVDRTLFERAVQGFWVWDLRSRGPSALILDESHSGENCGIARWIEDLAR